jgi:hypothetical protein
MISSNVMSAEALLFAIIALGGLLAVVQLREELMERKRQRKRDQISSTARKSKSLPGSKTYQASGANLAAVATEEET